MSRSPSPLRQRLALLALTTAALGSIATSRAPVLMTTAEGRDVLLDATQPTATRVVQVVLRPKAGVKRELTRTDLWVSLVLAPPPDAGTAGGPGTGTRKVHVRWEPGEGAAGGEQLREQTLTLSEPGSATVSDLAFEACATTECTGRFTLHLTLPEEERGRALQLAVGANAHTDLAPDEGELTVEFLE
jgi:hypothetical protein